MSGFTLNPQKTCSYCGYGCSYCILDEKLNPICKICSSETFLSDNKTCLICPNNCKKCQLEKDNKTKCLECNYNFYLLSNGTCGRCPDNCNECYLNKNNELSCLKCKNAQFALTPYETCIECSTISEIGGKSCETCGYNKEKGKYECYKCYREYDRIDRKYVDIYAFINNTFQCLNNNDPNQKYLYGCLNATYIQEKDIYECHNCKTDFIPILNKKVCRKPKVKLKKKIIFIQRL